MAKKPARKTKMTENTTSTPKTLADKLANAEALVAKYKLQIEQERILSDIQNDDDVDFTYGRDKTKRTLTGKVAAAAADANGVLWVRILSGEGIDMDTFKVRATDITANRTADARRAEEAKQAA